MADIRISVVVPVYNAAATAVDSIASCLNQQPAPFEVIVVDDGSTDNTVSVLRDAFGSRIRLIESERNGGPAAARNRGVALATGTHIAFQDADDRWHPDKLKLVHAVLEQRPDIRFLWHPYTLKPFRPVDGAADSEPQPYAFPALLWSNPIGTPCVIIQREDMLPLNEHMRHMEDYDLFLRIGRKTRMWKLRPALTQLGRPILTAGGQSSARWAMRRGELQAYANLVKSQPVYGVLYPFLAGFALLKHGAKAFFPPRENY